MLAAVLLAAGGSRRFGRGNKLLATLRGRALLDWSLAALIASPARRLVVVSGADRGRIERVARGTRDPRLRVVHNPRWRTGQSSSIEAGLKALRPIDRTLLIFLADMPAIAPEGVRSVVNALWTGVDGARPGTRDRPGHPVGIRRDALAFSSEGDAGLWQRLAGRDGARVTYLGGSARMRGDVDTQAALSRLRRELACVPRVSARHRNAGGGTTCRRLPAGSRPSRPPLPRA